MLPEPISSLQNPRVKEAARLRERRQRARRGLFLIDGARELGRALEAGIEIVEVFVCPERCATPQCRQLTARLAECGLPLVSVTPAVFAKLAYGERAEGLVGVARTPTRSLADLRLPAEPLVAVLEGIEKPGNVGAIVRSADAAGVSAVIVVDGGTDLYNPNAIRASMGTIFAVAVVAASKDELLDWIARERLAIVAARPDAATPYTAVDFRRPTAIVVGSEHAGLSAWWTRSAGAARAEQCVTSVRLPMCGAADSLNVSVTAAVLFYEALRQRGSHDTRSGG